MPILGSRRAFQILLYINGALVVAHSLVEMRSHDVNWLRIGNRSSLARACIEAEGVTALVTLMALFELYYPSMRNMFLSREAKIYTIMLVIQVFVWCVL